jgi:hypothetical protein
MISNYWMEVEDSINGRAFRYYFISATTLTKAISELDSKLPGWKLRDSSR